MTETKLFDFTGMVISADSQLDVYCTEYFDVNDPNHVSYVKNKLVSSDTRTWYLIQLNSEFKAVGVMPTSFNGEVEFHPNTSHFVMLSPQHKPDWDILVSGFGYPNDFVIKTSECLGKPERIKYGQY